MKYTRTSRIACLVLLALCLALGQEQQPQTATLPVGSATVDEIKGEVTIRSTAQATPVAAQRGQVLEVESILETAKGSAVLHLGDGSQVLVKPRSRVVLKAPERSGGTFFDLVIGKIMASVKKRLGTSPSFRMGTPTAVITVRGTKFEVNVDKKGKTYVQVQEGVVEVLSLAAPGRPIILRPGYWTNVDPGRAPSEPHSMSEMLDNGSSSEQERGGEREGRTGTAAGEDTPQSRTAQPSGERESEPH